VARLLTLKMVSVASAFESCAENKETVSGLYCYMSAKLENTVIQSWRYKTVAVINATKTTYCSTGT